MVPWSSSSADQEVRWRLCIHRLNGFGFFFAQSTGSLSSSVYFGFSRTAGYSVDSNDRNTSLVEFSFRRYHGPCESYVGGFFFFLFCLHRSKQTWTDKRRWGIPNSFSIPPPLSLWANIKPTSLNSSLTFERIKGKYLIYNLGSTCKLFPGVQRLDTVNTDIQPNKIPIFFSIHSQRNPNV